MAGEIRDKAPEYFVKMPAIPGEVPSNGTPTEREIFEYYTGQTQKSIEALWADPAHKDYTTCNDFVGHFTLAMVGVYLGFFQLEASLKKLGKGHSFVKSEPGVRPKYGDIFRAKSFHMGVFLDFDGDQINTAEGGQGGRKSRGYDIIKLKNTSFNPANYIGWCDIEKFAEKAPKPDVAEFVGPVPDTVAGWWQVWWDGQAKYFHFGRDRKAVWTKVKPKSSTQAPPAAVEGTGPMLIDVKGGVTVQWAAPSTWTDVLAPDPKDARKMGGLRNETVRLVANRL